jgi:hypothetical membrane protein
MGYKNRFKKTGTTKLVGICGILVPFVFFTGILIAISYSPWFKWTNNALSDLGVKGVSALIFNNGLIFGGVLALIFSIGLVKIFSNKIGAYILAISALGLIGAGLFPITMYALHYIMSAIFFSSLTVGLLVIGITMKYNQFDQNMGNVAIIAALLTFVTPVALYFYRGIAIPEMIICSLAYLWYMSYGAKIILKLA